jgi:hypothetical protein
LTCVTGRPSRETRLLDLRQEQVDRHFKRPESKKRAGGGCGWSLFVDTAEIYGPHANEELVGEAPCPYADLWSASNGHSMLRVATGGMYLRFRTPGSDRGTKQEVGAVDRGTGAVVRRMAPRFGLRSDLRVTRASVIAVDKRQLQRD